MNRLFARWAVGAVAVVGMCSSAVAAEQMPDDTGTGWRLERLDLELRVDETAPQLIVSGQATVRCDVEASFGPSMVINTRAPFLEWVRVEPADGTVEDLAGVVPEFPATRIARIRRTRSFAAGDTLQIAFETRSIDNGNQFHVDDGFATASWVTGWTPFPLPADDESWGSWLTQAPGTTRFDLPVTWRAVTNGDRSSRTERGERAIEVWQLDRPLARSYAAGPLTEAIVETGGRRVAVALLSPKPRSAENQAATLGRAIDAMSEVFGPYPYDRFSIVEVPDQVAGFWAASEQGFILAKPGVFATEDGNLPLFAHEAAHAWWGNLVGNDGPGGIFCSESISQYGAVLAIERLEGEAAATEFLRFSRAGYIPDQCARGYFEVVRSGEDRAIASIERGGGINHTIADAKGHWVHHMLRRRVGEDVYGQVVRRIVDDYTTQDLSLDAFRRAFVEAAPDAGLERFFEQWLDGTGAPALELQWSAEGDAVTLEIEQQQHEPPFELWLDVAIDLADGRAVTRRVSVSERKQSFRIDGIDGKPTGVRPDPNHQLLLWSPDYGPAPHADPLAGLVAAEDPGPAGTWAGGLQTPDGYLAGILRASRHDDRYSATFEFVRMPGMRIPMSEVKVEGDSIAMQMITPEHGTLRLDGVLQDRFLIGRASRDGGSSGSRFEFVRVVEPSAESLEGLAGEYTVDGRPLRIAVSPEALGGVLQVVIDDEPVRWLFPVGDDVFVHGPELQRPHPVEGTVRFERDDSGAVVGFERKLREGGSSRARRLHETPADRADAG